MPISKEELHKLSEKCDEIRGTGPIPKEIYLLMLERFALVPAKEDLSCAYLTQLKMFHDGGCEGCNQARRKANAASTEYMRKRLEKEHNGKR